MENLYESFTNEKSVSISGKDFSALNYGKEYSELFNGGERQIIISGETRSYSSSTGEHEFPQNVKFTRLEPWIRITEASHVRNVEYINTKLCLDEIVEILKTKGMRFDD